MKLLGTIVVLIFASQLAFAENVVVSVVLNPMGDFKAKTNDITGFATVKGTEISAENVVVKLTNLKTSIELRDKHVQKHLETTKYPDAVLVSAKGKDGKGTGTIKIHGVEKPISGTYKIVGKNVEADFDLNLPDFNITDLSYMGVTVEDKVKLHVILPIK
jgi:polyisoprenoid-binding protein YceI